MDNKLGRGLSALLGEIDNGVDRGGDVGGGQVDIDLISPNASQPRKSFDESMINELANSIKTHGVLQPIAVRAHGNSYEIIAGERRWRAAKAAGLRRVPVHIVDCEDSDILAMALVENIQRADLNPIEESEAIRTLLTNCECRQEDLSSIICKSRSYISNAIRLLSLPEEVQVFIREGRLSAGHGRCLVGAQFPLEMAQTAIANGWSVRELEAAMKEWKMGAKQEGGDEWTPLSPNEDPDAAAISERISTVLGVSAKLKITKKGGVLTLSCNSCEALERLTSAILALEDSFNCSAASYRD